MFQCPMSIYYFYQIVRIYKTALSMGIFKLNYQFRGDFHNFLDVIGSN